MTPERLAEIHDLIEKYDKSDSDGGWWWQDLIDVAGELVGEVERLTVSVHCSFCDLERENGTSPFCRDHVSIEAMRAREVLEASLGT